MASLKVICPKCLKGQQVVVDIPPGGIDQVCLLCKTSFHVRPAATPSSDDLPAAREAVPRPGDLPAPRGSLGTAANLPAPREAVPRPLDLPAARETVPRPADLPVDRNAVPRPGDLPVDRNTVPRPGDLPVDRNTVPRPGDLPIDRNAVPRPGDLPVDRNAVPRPGDLPVDRNAVPRPGDLPVDRNAVPRPILPPFAPPGAAAAPPPVPVLPARKSAERPAVKTPPLGLSLDLSLPQPPPPGPAESLTLGEPPAEAKGGFSLDLGLPPAVPPLAANARAGAPPRAAAKAPPPIPKGAPRFETKPLDAGPPAVAGPKAGAPAVEATLSSLRGVSSAPASAKPAGAARETRPAAHHKPVLAPLIPEPSESAPSPDAAPPDAFAPPNSPAGRPGENADLGFSLEFESSPRTSSGSSPVAIPFPAARVASEGMAEAAAENASDVPSLAPPSPRTASAARAMRPMARRSRIPRWAYFAGGAALVVAAAAAVAVPLLRSAPNPDNVLKPFLPELEKDSLVAYQNAATALKNIAANYKDSGAPLRLKAAELLLVSAAAHGGGPSDAATGEQAAAGAASQPKLAPAVQKVRALVAIVNGKPDDVDKLLADNAAPENQLVLGLARLAENKLEAAVGPLRAYVSARQDDMLGHYLLGRALNTGPEARKELELVLGKNPAHPGAQIGLARLEETPEKRLAAARALAEKKLPSAGPTELAILELTIGQAEQALGRSLEAISAYQKAIGLDKRLTAAYVALGEALLYEGKYGQALERLKAAGPALESTPAGKFALGGAHIATNAPGRVCLWWPRRPRKRPTTRGDRSGTASPPPPSSPRTSPPRSRPTATPSRRIPSSCPPPSSWRPSCSSRTRRRIP